MMMVNLCMQIFGALFVLLQEVWTQNETLQKHEISSSTNFSYETLCRSNCICGQVFHPFHASSNKNQSFARYRNKRWSSYSVDSVASQWLFQEIVSQKIHFPASFIFCQMLNFQYFPKLKVSLQCT